MNFTEKEKELVKAFDYQIFNNGIKDLYYNNYYRDMFNYLDALAKEGSEICIEVSNLIKRAFILIIDLDRFDIYKEIDDAIPKNLLSWNKELEGIENRYYSLSEELLSKFCIKKVKESIKPCYIF